jgi:hypothetical protein
MGKWLKCKTTAVEAVLSTANRSSSAACLPLQLSSSRLPATSRARKLG